MINFINPIWLTALPIVLSSLILIYLRKGSAKKKKVSSLFFIKNLPAQAPKAKKKFYLPLRLIIELVILSSLILAIAGMILVDRSETLTIIIDNPLRSLAKASPTKNDSLSILEIAKSEAISSIDFAPNLAKVSVWITSPNAINISNGFIETTLAKQKISAIQAAFADSNLELALSKVTGKSLVFSDAKLSAADRDYKPNQDLISFPDFGIEKKGKENIALESIAVEDSSIKVKIKHFLEKQSKCVIRLLSFNKSWSEIGQKKIDLESTGYKDIIFEINNQNSPLALKASIDSCSRTESNSLKQDDSVWLSSKAADNKISLISNYSLKELKLENLDNFDLIKPEIWDKTPKLNGVAIFHRYIPKKLPDLNCLFVYPEIQPDWIEIVPQSQKSELIDWDKDSQLLKYLSFPSVQLENSVTFKKLPSWSSVLLKSSAGDVAFYGSKNSKRYVGIGFELFPYEGKKNTSISILTLNLLNWIKNTQTSENNLLFIFDSQIKNISSLDSALINPEIKLSADNLRFHSSSPGLYELNLADNRILSAGNLFLESQSNLLSENIVYLANNNSSSSEPEQSNLFKWLCIFALIIILLDLSALIFKGRSNA